MLLRDFGHGFMILANVVGNPPAVHFIVDTVITRMERVAPFYVAGDKDSMFIRWNPLKGRTMRIVACVSRHRWHAQTRFI